MTAFTNFSIATESRKLDTTRKEYGNSKNYFLFCLDSQKKQQNFMKVIEFWFKLSPFNGSS